LVRQTSYSINYISKYLGQNKHNNFKLGTPDTVEIVGRFMISAVVCRVIVAYELAGQKIAARKYAAYEQTKGPENTQETPPNHPSASETENMLSSSLPRLASPDEDSRTAESGHRSSVELSYLNEQSTTSPTAVVANPFHPEEGRTRASPELGHASRSPNAAPAVTKALSTKPLARTEGV
jgi:hypothetical protein